MASEYYTDANCSPRGVPENQTEVGGCTDRSVNTFLTDFNALPKVSTMRHCQDTGEGHLAVRPAAALLCKECSLHKHQPPRQLGVHRDTSALPFLGYRVVRCIDVSERGCKRQVTDIHSHTGSLKDCFSRKHKVVV